MMPNARLTNTGSEVRSTASIRHQKGLDKLDSTADIFFGAKGPKQSSASNAQIARSSIPDDRHNAEHLSKTDRDLPQVS